MAKPSAWMSLGPWALMVGMGLVLQLGIIDDAYIFLRYARNLVEGHGLVFNPGERVEGFSSPLWTLIGALLFVLSGEPSPLLRGLSLLCLLGVLHLSNRYAVRHMGSPGRMVPLLLAAFFPLSCWGHSGMDVMLQALLFLAAVSVFSDEMDRGRRPWRSGALLGLMLWCRMESLVLLAAHLAWLGWTGSDRSRWRRRVGDAAALLGGFLPPALLLLAARQAYYGEWLPNTYYAKVDGGNLQLWRAGLRYTSRYALAAGVLIVPAVLSVFRWKRLDPWRQRLIFAAGFAAAGVAYVGGDHFAQYRFFVPITPVLAWLAAPWWIERIRAIQRGRPPRAAAVAVLLSASALALGLALPSFALGKTQGVRAFQREVRSARDHWSVIGRHFAARFPEGTVLATMVVGAIPYYSRMPTLDLLGLTDHRIARASAPTGGAYIGHEKHDSDYVMSRRPDIVMVRFGLYDRPMDEAEARRTAWAAGKKLLEHPDFGRRYEYVVEEVGGKFIVYHRRRDRPLEGEVP